MPVFTAYLKLSYKSFMITLLKDNLHIRVCLQGYESTTTCKKTN